MWFCPFFLNGTLTEKLVQMVSESSLMSEHVRRFICVLLPSGTFWLYFLWSRSKWRPFFFMTKRQICDEAVLLELPVNGKSGEQKQPFTKLYYEFQSSFFFWKMFWALKWCHFSSVAAFFLSAFPFLCWQMLTFRWRASCCLRRAEFSSLQGGKLCCCRMRHIHHCKDK